MRVLLGVALLLAVAGSATAADSPLFQRPDGSAIVFAGTVRAWCGTQNLNVLNLALRIRQSRWELHITRKRIHANSIVRFSWRRANGIRIFVYDAKTHNEASEGAEGSHGVITLRRATCRRGGKLAVRMSGTIASEFSDGQPVRVSGTYRGQVGPPPR